LTKFFIDGALMGDWGAAVEWAEISVLGWALG
jgi:hypothetical protein